MSLQNAMRSAGYEPPDNINAGQTVRFSTNKKSNDKSGWVYLFPDGKGASYGCWRSGEQHVWQEQRDTPYTSVEREKFKRDCIEANKARKIEAEAGYQKASVELLAEWEASPHALPVHPYLGPVQK